MFLKVLGNGQLRVFCANIGDSRCVLLRKSEAIYMTEDHNLSLPREIDRIINRKEAKWYTLPGDPQKLSWNTERTSRSPSQVEKLPLEKVLSMTQLLQIYPPEDRLDAARQVVCQIRAVSMKAFKDSWMDVYWDVSDICEDDSNDSSRGSIFLNPALSQSMDDLDATIHNTPLAALTAHSHHRGAVMQVEAGYNLSSPTWNNVDILHRCFLSLTSFATPMVTWLIAMYPF